MPLDCRNLAWRAAERYLVRTGLSGEVLISIEKHIPMAAGLAGGSSDAAAVLRGLNRLCGERLSLSELCTLGAELGADIPFCILGGGARVSGIGEVLEPLSPMPPCHLAVACMGEGISTPWGYAQLDEKYANFADGVRDVAPCDALIRAVGEGKLLQSTHLLYNIFEEIVPAVRPHVGLLKQTMLDAGAVASMMSGSGPSVFGVFPDADSATRAVDTLRALGAAAFVCHPVGKY
jgi:4-diphosphocytidyl-2-C-methyl-D-erythritol kinase